MKEKKKEEKLFIDEHLCNNACQSCYDNLIREERKKIEKEKTYKLKKRFEKKKNK